jgi:hypothetical protein
MAQSSTTDRSKWASALEQLTRDHEGEDVTIEVLDGYGDNEEARHVPFTYASYDSRDDAVIVGIGARSGRHPLAVRRMIWHPVEVEVDDMALRVVDIDGTTTLVRFAE